MDIDRTMMVMILEREPFYTAGEDMNWCDIGNQNIGSSKH